MVVYVVYVVVVGVVEEIYWVSIIVVGGFVYVGVDFVIKFGI